MFIPGRIAAHLVGDAIEQEQLSQAARHEMHAMSVIRERMKLDANAGALWEACTGPDACLLVITGANLRDCTVDGVSLADARAHANVSNASPYRSGASIEAQSLYAVCPGLHLLSTSDGEETATAYVALHPKEARAFAPDFARRTWSLLDAAEEERLVKDRNASVFYDYNAHVAAARVRKGVVQSAPDVLGTCEKWLQQGLAAVQKDVPAKGFELAESARAVLVGTPVGSLAPLTDFVGFHAFELHRRGETSKARTLVEIGLVMLPESPTLLAVLGELLLASGAAEGRAILERALRRESVLSAPLRDRARALLQ